MIPCLVCPIRRRKNQGLREKYQRIWLPPWRDYTSKQIASILRAIFAEVGLDVPEWPAKSPDLRVTENIWGRNKLLLQREEILAVKDIERVVPLLRNKIVSEEKYLANLFDSIPNRVQKVLENNGARVRY